MHILLRMRLSIVKSKKLKLISPTILRKEEELSGYQTIGPEAEEKKEIVAKVSPDPDKITSTCLHSVPENNLESSTPLNHISQTPSESSEHTLSENIMTSYDLDSHTIAQVLEPSRHHLL
ncbi:unnamed protein product [Vicia faba]|uniref:Uncharacterized protein n=1 Tax=Vicia faba TaxID=3906 RepID=A0AAV1A6B5_VICFA|nr:unnamed protein product [Vicia faba]